MGWNLKYRSCKCQNCAREASCLKRNTRCVSGWPISGSNKWQAISWQFEIINKIWAHGFYRLINYSYTGISVNRGFTELDLELKIVSEFWTKSWIIKWGSFKNTRILLLIRIRLFMFLTLWCNVDIWHAPPPHFCFMMQIDLWKHFHRT